MTKTVFSTADLDLWRLALERDKPEEISDESWESLEQIDSIRMEATNVGAVMRLRRKDGTILDIILNPVVSRHVAACILKQGQEAGWLDEKGDIILPPVSFDA